MQHTDACAGCVVTHVLGADSHGVVFDLRSEQIVHLLVEAGLVPGSQHRRVV